MFDNEKEAVLNVINSLWAHDAWNWGNTCAKLVNQEIDWDKPAILDIDGEYITANVYVKDGREFQIGYQEGGWFMCFIKDCNDLRARLTKRAPDAPDWVCRNCEAENPPINTNCFNCNGTARW